MLSPRLIDLVSQEIHLTFTRSVEASKHRVVSLFTGVGGLELAFSSPKPERLIEFHLSPCKFLLANSTFKALDSTSA